MNTQYFKTVFNNSFNRALIAMVFLGLLITLPAVAGPGAAGHDHHNHDSPVQSSVSDHHDTVDSQGGEHDHGAHAWETPEGEKNRPNPMLASTESISRGERLFRHYCITCHGFEADGATMRGQNLNPRAANLREMAGHHTDGDYHYKIRTGHGPMPNWEETISEDNIWHLVNYLQSLKPSAKPTRGHGIHAHSKSQEDAENPGYHDHGTHQH